MYRVRLDPIDYPDWMQYALLDLDIATFVDIAIGIPVLAIMTREEELSRGIEHGPSYYTAVWDPVTNRWVNDLTAEQAQAVYAAWWRDDYP